MSNLKSSSQNGPLSVIWSFILGLALVMGLTFTSMLALTSDTAVKLDVASVAEAHISTCKPAEAAPPVKVGKPYVGGFTGFTCEAFDNHHEYVEIKSSIMVRTLNLPGTKADMYSYIKSVHSPHRKISEARSMAAHPAIAPCLGNGNVYLVRTELSIVGRQGIRYKKSDSEPAFLSCNR